MKSARFASICTFLLLLSVCAHNTFAFNGQRKGFILGIGLGVGQTSGIDNDKKIGINTDFKIGHGFSDNTQIYWSAKSSFIQLETGNQYFGFKNETFLSGCGSIAISHFFNPKAPSIYLTGGVGYASFGKLQPEEGDPEYDLGIGYFSGVGYEFSPHWSVEVNLIAGSPGPSRYDYDMSVWTIKATINTLAY